MGMPVFIVRIWTQLIKPYMDQRDLGYVQNDPQYKDKTALVLPTDHDVVIYSRMDKSWK
jgi:hypothetical protein